MYRKGDERVNLFFEELYFDVLIFDLYIYLFLFYVLFDCSKFIFSYVQEIVVSRQNGGIYFYYQCLLDEKAFANTPLNS
jgi:hypothetical protein